MACLPAPDGRLSLLEYTQAFQDFMAQLGADASSLDSKQIAQTFAEFDHDKDGKVACCLIVMLRCACAPTGVACREAFPGAVKALSWPPPCCLGLRLRFVQVKALTANERGCKLLRAGEAGGRCVIGQQGARLVSSRRPRLRQRQRLRKSSLLAHLVVGCAGAAERLARGGGAHV